jgi:hypothetical protein
LLMSQHSRRAGLDRMSPVLARIQARIAFGSTSSSSASSRTVRDRAGVSEPYRSLGRLGTGPSCRPIAEPSPTMPVCARANRSTTRPKLAPEQGLEKPPPGQARRGLQRLQRPSTSDPTIFSCMRRACGCSPVLVCGVTPRNSCSLVVAGSGWLQPSSRPGPGRQSGAGWPDTGDNRRDRPPMSLVYAIIEACSTSSTTSGR